MRTVDSESGLVGADRRVTCPETVGDGFKIEDVGAMFPDAVGVFELREEGKTCFLNPRFAKLFGGGADDFPSVVDFSRKVFPEEYDQEMFLRWWSGLIETAPDRIRAKRWVVCSKGEVSRDMTCAGAVFGNHAILHFRDISKLRRILKEKRAWIADKCNMEAETAKLKTDLEKQNQQTVNTLDALVDPHIIIHPRYDELGRIDDWVVSHANLAAGETWKINNLEAGGQSLKDFIVPQHSPPILAWLRDVLSTGDPLSINDYAYGEVLCGEERRFDIQIARVDGCLSLTWRDVTERFNAVRKTAESEERYRLIAQNSSDVIVLTDNDKIVRWISPSVTPILGWDFRDWVGRHCTDFLVNQKETDDFDKHSVSVTKNGQPERFRKQIRSSDGAVHWVEAHSGPYISASGRAGGVVTSFRTIDSQVSMENELVRLAKIDELTKLLSRREGLDQLKHLQTQAERTGELLAVLFVDLDGFKSINDTYGHSSGDDVLRSIGKRVHSCLRTGDDVGVRVGGDEMLVVLRGVHGLEDALSIAEKLRRKVSEPIMSQKNLICATVSIGVSISQPDENVEVLISRADEAMYQAKTKGRDQVVAIPATG